MDNQKGPSQTAAHNMDINDDSCASLKLSSSRSSPLSHSKEGRENAGGRGRDSRHFDRIKEAALHIPASSRGTTQRVVLVFLVVFLTNCVDIMLWSRRCLLSNIDDIKNSADRYGTISVAL